MIADPDRRRRDMAAIHIAAKQLGMDDGTYRDMLWSVARVRSAADLDFTGLQRVRAHLKACGFKSAKPKTPHPGRPSNIDSADRGPLLRKVEALLTDARREWAYADGMVKRMFHVERTQFCTPEQLRKLIAALTYDQRRRKA